MSKKIISVLLVEDDPVAAGLFHAQLASDFTTRFQTEVVDALEKALVRLASGRFDVIVLDLVLPDCRGLEALDAVRRAASGVPVVVFTGLDDEQMAAEALQHGAQDYLVKGDLTGRLISRSLRHAIERQRLTEALRGLSLLDDLTGHYNRRGFLTLAEQQLNAARRLGRGIALIAAEIEPAEDQEPPTTAAIRELGEVLRNTFRGSDLTARICGARFLVLASEPNRAGAETAFRRLRQRLAPGSDAGARIGRVTSALDWTDSAELSTVKELVSGLEGKIPPGSVEAGPQLARHSPPS